MTAAVRSVVEKLASAETQKAAVAALSAIVARNGVRFVCAYATVASSFVEVCFVGAGECKQAVAAAAVLPRLVVLMSSADAGVRQGSISAVQAVCAGDGEEFALATVRPSPC